MARRALVSANIGCGLHITETWLLWQKLTGLHFSDVTRCLEVGRSGQVQLLEEVIMDPGRHHLLHPLPVSYILRVESPHLSSVTPYAFQEYSRELSRFEDLPLGRKGSHPSPAHHLATPIPHLKINFSSCHSWYNLGAFTPRKWVLGELQCLLSFASQSNVLLKFRTSGQFVGAGPWAPHD